MWFEATYELKINFEKNKLIRGVNVEMLPTTYFRLPLVVSYKSIVIWDRVEERLLRRLVIKSTLPSLPIYKISFFVILRKANSKLKKVQQKCMRFSLYSFLCACVCRDEEKLANHIFLHYIRTKIFWQLVFSLILLD